MRPCLKETKSKHTEAKPTIVPRWPSVAAPVTWAVTGPLPWTPSPSLLQPCRIVLQSLMFLVFLLSLRIPRPPHSVWDTRHTQHKLLTLSHRSAWVCLSFRLEAVSSSYRLEIPLDLMQAWLAPPDFCPTVRTGLETTSQILTEFESPGTRHRTDLLNTAQGIGIAGHIWIPTACSQVLDASGKRGTRIAKPIQLLNN